MKATVLFELVIIIIRVDYIKCDIANKRFAEYRHQGESQPFDSSNPR